jgi:Protein of unknown function (DUF3078)
MSVRSIRFCLIIVFIAIYISAFSQEDNRNIIKNGAVSDSLRKEGTLFPESNKLPHIQLSKAEALKYLKRTNHAILWNNTNDSLRMAFGRVIYETEHPPFDSTKAMLARYPFDSLNITPIFESKFADTLKVVTEAEDTLHITIYDTLKVKIPSSSFFPFKYHTSPFQGDSIKSAINSLLNYLDDRDSAVIIFTGLGNTSTPVMLNSKSDKEIRYWLKNEFPDSVTVWIGNPSRNTIALYLEQGVNFRRPVRQGNYAKAKVDILSVDKSKLLDMQHIVVKPLLWKYKTESSFIMSQTTLTNWVKGGENSISGAIDITCYADYNNLPLKLSSNSFIRLNLGFLKSGGSPLRKNIDLLETNSKLNHKAFGKFDFSAILLFKTQVASGYDYSSEPPLLVSKFLNPAVLTMGLGLDYKPDKNTSLNLSPLSYKATFMTDTAHIDQTKYGIPKNRKSLIEPGASFMITNEYKPVKTVSIINRLQLFTNYIHNPQNVDVDWEMISAINLNWFTDLRIDTHLIFDDDTKTPVLDKTGNPVLLPDRTVKKTARIQFKEMVGISLSFRF